MYGGAGRRAGAASPTCSTATTTPTPAACWRACPARPPLDLVPIGGSPPSLDRLPTAARSTRAAPWRWTGAGRAATARGVRDHDRRLLAAPRSVPARSACSPHDAAPPWAPTVTRACVPRRTQTPRRSPATQAAVSTRDDSPDRASASAPASEHRPSDGDVSARCARTRDGRLAAPPCSRCEHLVKSFPLRGRLLRRCPRRRPRRRRRLVPRRRGARRSAWSASRGAARARRPAASCASSSPTRARCVFDGTDLTTLPAEPLRRVRRRFQMVFQDPQASLNPRMTVGELLAEPLMVHGIDGGRRARPRRRAAATSCSCRATAADRYPHQFSGGQRQRIGIARALAVGPDCWCWTSRCRRST